MSGDRYPMVMRHPSFSPGRPAVQDPRTGAILAAGEPARYGDQVVNDEDQEEYLKAQGYVANGVYDARAYETASVGAAVGGYEPAEYPKYLAAYDKVVESIAEELALLEKPAPKARIEQTDPPPLATAEEIAAEFGSMTDVPPWQRPAVRRQRALRGG